MHFDASHLPTTPSCVSIWLFIVDPAIEANSNHIWGRFPFKKVKFELVIEAWNDLHAHENGAFFLTITRKAKFLEVGCGGGEMLSARGIALTRIKPGSSDCVLKVMRTYQTLLPVE